MGYRPAVATTAVSTLPMALKFNKAGEQELLHLFLNQLAKESDRGCALVAAGYLEDQLKKVLQARMVKHTGPAEEIFEGHEALSTFSARIKLAYLLGIVSHEVFLDLNRIREIRNAFGHNLEIDSFLHTSVAQACTLFENVQEEWLTDDEHTPARKKFTRCAMAIDSILASCLVQSEPPKADRQNELDTLNYWKDILSI
jgi:hypothetical protein